MQKLELELFHHELTNYRDSIKKMGTIVELSDKGYEWLDKQLAEINADLAWMERSIARQKARRAGRTLEQRFAKFVASIVPKRQRKGNA